MAPDSSCLLLGWLLVLSLAVFVGQEAAAYKLDPNDVPAPILDLTHRSFSLNSRLSIFSGGSKVVFQLDEMHSAWQKRSKLHFRAFGSPDSGDTQPKLAPIKEGSTIYCTDQDVLIWSGLSCSSISHDYVDILFNRGVLSGFDSGNLAGAARLLLFIEKNFAKFTLGSTEQMPANTMDKVRYVAEFSPLSGGLNEFSLTLLYDEVRANNLPHGIPRRVIIMIPRTKVVISYDFLRYTPIKVDQFLTANKVFKYSNNVFNDVGSIELDLFAIDRAIGCSQSMTQASTRGPGAISQTLEKIDKSRFSFSAKPPTPRGVSAIDLTVAYEPHFSILRVDNVRSTRSESTITDFQHDSKFNIIRRHSSDKDLVFDGVGISSDRDRSCVVSQVKAKGYKSGGGLKNPYTLGQMLLGTERLVYLGLARVRGIEARVYESYNCNWPIWLQQPSVYKELRGEHLNMSSSSSDQVGRLYLRDESKIIKARGLSLTNVFYFSSHGPPNQDDDDLLDSKLLLVEVFTKIDSGNHVRRHQYYPVYDFSWSLANSAPDGGRYEDLFSLHDDCLAEINYEQAASVDLLLETELHLAKQAWLLDRSRRNLALIYMAQNELDLTSTMLYDVESKFIMDSGQTYLDKNHRLASVAASIRVSQRTKSVTRLLYAGTAFVSREEDVNVYPAFNFHSCHMLAAHLRKNVIFAYEAPEFGCYLLKPELDGTSVASIMKNTFKFSDRAYVEVYQIFHPEAGDDDYIINELATIRSKTKQLHDLTLPDLTLADADILDPETSVHFKIKELHLNDVGNNYYTSDDGLHMSDTNKFSGYGLVASDGQNKLVQPKCIEDPETRIYHQNEMSFEHCQTACLADLDCRAYSVCIVEDQMQCVLSTVSFGTPSMVIQLMQLKRTGKKIKLGTKLPIKVDPNEQKFIVANSKLASKLESLESIQVVKHPNCELHNRLNRNLFTKSSQGATTMVNSLSSIRPVAHFEQCATLCFRMTVLRMIWNALGSNATRTQPEKTSSPSSSAGLAICGHVYYVDHETVASSIEPEYMKKLFEELNQQHDFVGGYCILDEPDRPTDERGLYDIFKDIKLDLYEFDFSTLYTKQKDVTLMTSEMDTGEFALLNEQPTIGGGPPPVLEANANFGTARETKSISECAKLCLNPQAKVAYPACRSFEYIEITKARDKKIVKFCGFNSVTLKSSLRAGRFDLIRHGADKQERVHLNPNLGTKVWHFDPREGIIEKTLDEVYKIVHARDLEVARETSSQLHVHGLGLFGIIMFTLSLGMIAGFVLGIRIITKLIPLTEDVENLVTDSPPEEPKILFCNMVDFEGHIVEQDQEEAPATDEPAPVLPVAETGENNA